MKVFADTFFFLALLDSSDAAHVEARLLARKVWSRIYTTDFVLIELANALSAPADRQDCLALVATIRSAAVYEIVPASAALLEAGWALYAARPDKHWSLTDCISMHVMRELGVTDVLTADHHFTQAGLHVLFPPDDPS